MAHYQGLHALRLDPLSYTTPAALCWTYWIARQYDRLLEQAKLNVELHPDVPHSHWPLGFAYLETGNLEAAIPEMRVALEVGRATLYRALLAETCAVAEHSDEAREILQQLLSRSHEQYVTPYMVARIYTALGDVDQAFRWLNVSYQERAPWMVLLKRDPRLDSLRADQRYGSLLQLMNFPA